MLPGAHLSRQIFQDFLFLCPSIHLACWLLWSCMWQMVACGAASVRCGMDCWAWVRIIIITCQLLVAAPLRTSTVMVGSAIIYKYVCLPTRHRQLFHLSDPRVPRSSSLPRFFQFSFHLLVLHYWCSHCVAEILAFLWFVWISINMVRPFLFHDFFFVMWQVMYIIRRCFLFPHGGLTLSQLLDGL